MSRLSYAVLITLCLLWRYLIASFLPLGHDEVYYWDWASKLDWGYFDHPAGVALLSYINQIFADGYLGARFFNPILHLISSLLLLRSAFYLNGKRLSGAQTFAWFVLTQTVPYFHIGSISLMPDIPLLFISSLFLERAVFLATREKFSKYNFILLGLLLGLGFNAKYHAIVILGVMALSALVFDKKFQKLRLVVLFLLGFIVGVMPVVYWNYANDFVSFKFQTHHGFAGLVFKPRFFLQTTLAQIVLFGPFLIIAIPTILNTVKGLKKTKSYLLFGSVCLILLLAGLGFYKKILPHWVLPAIWLLIPWLVVYEKRKYMKFQLIYGLCISLILSILVIKPVRNLIVERYMGNKPAALGEMTMWEPLSDSFDENHVWQDLADNRDIMIAFRWFDTAHLNFENRSSKRVYNFDLNKPSFYFFRDGTHWWHGKSFLAVTVNSNLPKGFTDIANINSRKEYPVKGHLDRKVTVYKGKFYSKDQLQSLVFDKNSLICKSYLTKEVCN